MANVSLRPGSMGVVKQAVDLFGPGRVNPGNWLTPVWVIDLTVDEADFAREFFAELGITVEEAAEHAEGGLLYGRSR